MKADGYEMRREMPGIKRIRFKDPLLAPVAMFFNRIEAQYFLDTIRFLMEREDVAVQSSICEFLDEDDYVDNVQSFSNHSTKDFVLDRPGSSHGGSVKRRRASWREVGFQPDSIRFWHGDESATISQQQFEWVVLKACRVHLRRNPDDQKELRALTRPLRRKPTPTIPAALHRRAV